MKVPFADFSAMHAEIRDGLDAAIANVLDSNCFIGGEANAAFEEAFAAYTGVGSCVGCGNGLDALHLILRALDIGPGDEVIVPAHTFIATALAVTYAGAKPVFVDVEPEYYCLDATKLEAAVNERTRAVIMVHIYGQIGHMDKVRAVAQRHDLLLIEDAAQAHGALYKGQKAGSLGVASGFSFYPGKNLGAFGDAGAVTTDDVSLARRIRTMGNYGSQTKYQHVQKGINSRLDTLQAAVLHKKLRHLDKWTKERQRIAALYIAGIHNPQLKLPAQNPDGEHVWHIFPVMAEDRERFLNRLAGYEIKALIHYPVPMHLHKAYLDLGYARGDFPAAEYIAAHEVSLPMFYGMTDEQVEYVIRTVNAFS